MIVFFFFCANLRIEKVWGNKDLVVVICCKTLPFYKEEKVKFSREKMIVHRQKYPVVERPQKLQKLISSESSNGSGNLMR